MKNNLSQYGLTSEQVEKRIQMGQKNTALAPLTRSIKQIIYDNTCTLFNLINLTIAVFIIYTGSYKNLLYLGVVISNTAIGIFQEIRAKRQIDKMAFLAESKIAVWRDSKLLKIKQNELVQDDLILLKRGDQVPADGLLTETTGIEVDESPLTGEANAISKKVGDTVLSGSYLVSGEATIQLTAVGAESFISKLSLEAKQEKRTTSILLQTINRIIQILSYVIIPLGILLFISSHILRANPLNTAILGSAAAMLGMIPEGLVLLTSVALAVGAVNLARNRVLVRSLPAIETLARVDMLCLDKTGTITSGKQQLVEISSKDNHTNAQLSTAAALLAFGLHDDNPTSLALQKGLPKPSEFNIVQAIPFSSERKWSGAQFSGLGTFVMGAPEFVFPNLAENWRSEIAHFSKQGYRVLCVASSTEDLSLHLNNLTLMGFLILSDEIRPEAIATFGYFKKQEVEIKVISGDNAATVANIAHRAGIEHAEKYIDMSQTSEKTDFKTLAHEYTVFGRVTPTQKRDLIVAMQALKHTVAMTGDGVNDVLALRSADCSIAMATGNEATKSIADFVLLDSNFSAMIHVLNEGRRVINNIERVASLYLIKTIYSIIITIAVMFFSGLYPFQPIQLSPISALTVGIPSFFLALSPNYHRVKGHFMRNVMVTALPAALCVVTYIFAIIGLGHFFNLPFAQTSTLSVLLTGAVCFSALYQITEPRNFKNIALIASLISIFVCIFLFAGPLFSLSSLLNWTMFKVYLPLLISVYPFFTFIQHFLGEKFFGRIKWK